jgi:hypothetical protein
VEPTDSKGLLERIPKYLALLGPVCVGFSVVYDWGYLYGLGLSFREVPTSISDHLRSAIIWLPYTIVYLFFVVVLGFYLARKEAALLSGPAHRERTERLYKLLWTAHGILLIVLWVLLGDRMVGLGAFGVGQLVVAVIPALQRGAPEQAQKAYLLGGGAFLFASCLFALGNVGATSSSNTEPRDELEIKKRDATEIVRGTILRRFEQCLIIVNDKHVILLLKPDDLVRVTLGSAKRTNKGMLCDSFNVMCPSVLPGAKKPISESGQHPAEIKK